MSKPKRLQRLGPILRYGAGALTQLSLTSERADLTKLHLSTNSIHSLSCMHVIEHIGLGRYGDPLDYDGDLKAASELRRVLAVGGQLLIAVPIGGEARIQFNAHQIYTYRQVLELFSPLKLDEFSLIPDDAREVGMFRHADESRANEQSYACGCFVFRKEAP